MFCLHCVLIKRVKDGGSVSIRHHQPHAEHDDDDGDDDCDDKVDGQSNDGSDGEDAPNDVGDGNQTINPDAAVGQPASRAPLTRLFLKKTFLQALATVQTIPVYF